MELSHVYNFINGKSTLQLYGGVGDSDGINGGMVSAEIAYLDARPDVSEIELLINSQGGSVVQAMSIVSAIRACSTKVVTVVDGLAASAASFISVCGDERKMVDFGRLMVHNPSYKGEDKDSQDPKLMAALDNFGGMIAKLMASKSGKSEEEVLLLMDAETWMDAETAKESGMVDEILVTDLSELTSILNSTDLQTADLGEIVNTITIQKHKTVDLSKLTAALVIAASASIEDIEAKILELKTENEKLKLFKASHEALAKEAKEAKVVAVIDKAIENKQVPASQKDFLVGLGNKDLEALENFLAELPKPSHKITPTPTGGEDENGFKVVNGMIDGKGLRALEKENPRLVQRISNEAPELYKEMYDAEYSA